MIPVARPALGEEELKNVTEAIKSTWISSKGRFIGEFEEKFAEYCGTKYGISTSNGTAALHLALKALEIGKGDEVIIPDLTFIATANAVMYCNAIPVLVDSHCEYWCMDPGKIREKITPKTKAIIAVHLYGHPCDMDVILDVAKAHNLYVIEDAAEAHGAEYKGRKTGSFGDVSCFSFYGNKIITTGEGGMCLTDNKALAERMKILRNQAMDTQKRYWYNAVGFNYRMTNVQAAIGLAQLAKINQFIEQKRQIACWYSEGLEYLKKQGMVILHPEMPWARCVYWLYTILIEDKFGINRDKLMRLLEKKGVEVRPSFYPIHIMPPYKRGDAGLNFAKTISFKGLSLPSSTTIRKDEVNYIIDICLHIANAR